MRRTETPKPIWIKFCMVVDVPDAVTNTNFGDHRLRGFWMAGGHISPSPIDFHRRPYNTLALPCERVIICHYTKTRRHPQNRKFMTYCNAATGVPGKGNGHCKKLWKFRRPGFYIGPMFATIIRAQK